MQFFGIFFIIFGILVIAFPAFLAYMIGFFFFFLGVNMLFLSYGIKKANMSSGKGGFTMGGYEIVRKK